MLVEKRDVRQIPEEGTRRWFTDREMDLIVWLDAEKRITGFQLCYDKGEDERAFTWRSEAGYDHTRIDDGEVPGQSKMTPILVADGLVDRSRLLEEFERESRYVDKEVRAFVMDKVRNFTGPEADKPRRTKP